MKLDSNNHSVFLLYYHLVLVVKYRRNVFDDDMSDYAKDMFIRLSENYNITLVEWHYDVDHVHILFKAHPNTKMTKFINAYKSASSRLIKRDFPQVKKKLWKEMFWSRSFCLLTTGGSPIDVVKEYIENQGEK
ncbi:MULTISPECIES: IS200/IS605 family transposase [Bacillus]|uniref:IS200/IS605 family transposase n=1 Tax=Bacillus TaxID=1386 RepID=UPI0019145B95|nr:MULTISPECIES: IS200/IS605 family transposase [Bacillus]MBK5503039.1 IS200/IS605 family transposase [Bacillus sp. TH12]QWG42590.1 IS200/IS605 family transposase [Bacillus mycoides]QWI77955.1 IS200/IS605 family transposase [Bacillus mycoides]